MSEAGPTFLLADLFDVLIPVNAARPAEKDVQLLFRVVETISNATVDSVILDIDSDFDALFGIRTPGDFLEERRILFMGTTELVDPPLTARIRKDFVIEELECFTIEILPVEIGSGSGQDDQLESFICNEDEVDAVDHFCLHTICIEDDDGELSHHSYIFFFS